MARHLTPEELTSVVDGTLDASRLAHTQTCARCQGDVQSLRETLELLQSTRDDEEPSPLFWDHFSARVRSATDELPASRTRRWKYVLWPAGVVGAAALLLISVGRQPMDPGVTTVPAADVAAEQSWDAIVAVAEELSADEIDQVAATQPAVLFDDLTPDEQVAFARLLERELGVDQ